jgi:predicted HAD superfamily Cof-like phosphohydrolase
MTLPDQTVNTEVFDDLDFSIFDADWVADNFEMHTHFEVHDAVAKLDREKLLKLLEFRINFLQEELNEAKAGLTTLQALQTAGGDVTTAGAVAAEDVVDAMIDLCVVAIGTLDLFQVDAYEAWDRVHAANMAKEVGIKPGRPNPLGLPDLIKPAGWVGPRHDDNLGILPRLYSVEVDTE